MSDLKKTTTGKHHIFNDRIEIRDCLFHGVSFKRIAMQIGKDPMTVSKEDKKHIQVIPARTENPRPCPDLLKAPFVCNGCQRMRNCMLEKHEYLARFAHKAYRETLVESLSGIALSKESFCDNDRIITEGINKEQYLYHLVQTQNLSVSKSTFYTNFHLNHIQNK